jgi:hypothetical protein
MDVESLGGDKAGLRVGVSGMSTKVRGYLRDTEFNYRDLERFDRQKLRSR